MYINSEKLKSSFIDAYFILTYLFLFVVLLPISSFGQKSSSVSCVNTILLAYDLPFSYTDQLTTEGVKDLATQACESKVDEVDRNNFVLCIHAETLSKTRSALRSIRFKQHASQPKEPIKELPKGTSQRPAPMNGSDQDFIEPFSEFEFMYRLNLKSQSVRTEFEPYQVDRKKLIESCRDNGAHAISEAKRFCKDKLEYMLNVDSKAMVHELSQRNFCEVPDFLLHQSRLIVCALKSSLLGQGPLILLPTVKEKPGLNFKSRVDGASTDMKFTNNKIMPKALQTCFEEMKLKYPDVEYYIPPERARPSKSPRGRRRSVVH